MSKFNITINGKYVGTTAATGEHEAAEAAFAKFNAAGHDCLTVTRVELGRKHHNDAAIEAEK